MCNFITSENLRKRSGTFDLCRRNRTVNIFVPEIMCMYMHCKILESVIGHSNQIFRKKITVKDNKIFYLLISQNKHTSFVSFDSGCDCCFQVNLEESSTGNNEYLKIKRVSYRRKSPRFQRQLISSYCKGRLTSLSHFCEILYVIKQQDPIQKFRCLHGELNFLVFVTAIKFIPAKD